MQIQKPKHGYKLVKSAFGKQIEIPEEWDFVKILDNSTLKGRIGWQGLTTAEYRQKGEFYLVTGTDFKDGKIDWENCVYVDEERYVQDTNIQLKKGDVLVTKDGTIGKIAYIDMLPLPTTLNSGVFVIRPVGKTYFPLFLYYILYSDYFTKFLNRLKAGSTINHLYQKDFVNFHFPIPPYPEQQKIASILTKVDSLINQTQKIIKQTQRLKKGLMQKLLTKGIGHSKFKNSEIGKIPEKWNIVRLEEACLKSKNSFSMGPFGSDIKTDNFVQSGVPVIRGINLTKQPFYENGFVFITENKADELKAANAFSGDLIFTHRGTLGQVGVIPFNSKFKRYVISQSQMKCTCDSNVLDPMFAFYFFTSNSGQKIIMTHSTKSGVPHIIQPLTSLRSFPIPLPEINEQKIIVGFISEVNSLVESQQEYKSNLETLKKGLMQKLLTGQIRVKV